MQTDGIGRWRLGGQGLVRGFAHEEQPESGDWIAMRFLFALLGRFIELLVVRE